MLVVRPEKFK